MSLCELLGIDEPEVVEDEEEFKRKKLTPFDFFRSITSTKQNLLEEDPNAESDYIPYIVNRTLTHSPVLIHVAQYMNVHSNIPKKQHYSFLLSLVRKRNYNDKWTKSLDKESIEYKNIEVIKKYYDYSSGKAKQAMLILTQDQINELSERMNTGGLKRGK